jgi:hypothetical protein
MRPLAAWSPRTLTGLALAWVALVLGGAHLATIANYEHISSPDGTEVWSVFSWGIPAWAYWLAFVPPVLLLLLRLRRGV